VLKHDKRTHVKQVAAELVQAKEWDKATEQLKQNFPTAISIGIIEEILEQVYVADDDPDNLTSAILWVDTLDASLRPGAYGTLYEQTKFKGHTDQPQVLMLWKRVNDLLTGVSDVVRSQLDEDSCKLSRESIKLHPHHQCWEVG
jgi:hypothetical protein